MQEILSDRVVIEIIGSDAVKFLQNLVTNDIKTHNYCYTYLLNNQGRYIFDFFVYTYNANKLLVDVNKYDKLSFIEQLNFYKLRSKIEIVDSSDKYYVIYSNDAVEESLFTIRDPRYRLLKMRSIVNKKPKTSTTGVYLEDKYNFAIIDGYEDLLSNKSIPIEYGAEELNSISYDKGCYVGQEVISRAKYQGVIRKKIFKISAKQDLLEVKKGDDIFADNSSLSKLGVICSVYKNKAIALIRYEQYQAHQSAQFTVAGYDISLSLPDWYKNDKNY